MKLPVIMFYPELPTENCRIFHQLKNNGIKFHNDPNLHYDLHFYWSYHKFKTSPDKFTLKHKPINWGCTDISKQKVNDIFNDISVDPLQYNGIAVAKREKQGAHKDHKLITCPITKPDPEYIYQRYIENKEKDSFVYYRLFYAEGIKMITKRLKKSMFITDYHSDSIVKVRKYFRSDRALVQKCNAFGFHFGEIDFLMNNSTPIIIDINNVAGYRAPSELEKIKEKIFLEYIMKKFNSKIK